MNEKAELINVAAGIVSAYVGNNSVAQSDLPGLIHEVYIALASASREEAAGRAEQLKPAVSIKKSVTNDYIICLEDGQKFKSLKRHLRTHYKMSPDEYRAKWGLPKDYPMVAPNYAQTRSALAKQMGLGQKGRTSKSKR
jgi:predicted transcriptional regulator